MNLRASVCVGADSEEEGSLFDGWLSRWKEEMTFVSGDYGDGCCVHLFDVEGPKAAIDAIPEAIRCQSKWVEAGVKSGNPQLDIVPQK
jgi:hypothetical protein